MSSISPFLAPFIHSPAFKQSILSLLYQQLKYDYYKDDLFNAMRNTRIQGLLRRLPPSSSSRIPKTLEAVMGYNRVNFCFSVPTHNNTNHDCERINTYGSTTNLHSNQRRFLATGTRGSRGHGWYVNYNAGKGGRHLQGEYHDADSLKDRERWNQAVLEVGSRQLYIDVAVEPRTSGSSGDAVMMSKKNFVVVPPLDELSKSSEKHRLLIDVASAIMPETCQNFVDLCSASKDGYKGSLLYRIERNVGICGGDVLSNTGKTGKAANGTPLSLTIEQDPLAMWHLPGTVTMTVAKVEEIDSRFVLCTNAAQHLDGNYRAFGKLTDDSLAIVRGWEENLLTKKGVPTSFQLIITDCGLVEARQEDGLDSDRDGQSSVIKESA